MGKKGSSSRGEICWTFFTFFMHSPHLVHSHYSCKLASRWIILLKKKLGGIHRSYQTWINGLLKILVAEPKIERWYRSKKGLYKIFRGRGIPSSQGIPLLLGKFTNVPLNIKEHGWKRHSVWTRLRLQRSRTWTVGVVAHALGWTVLQAISYQAWVQRWAWKSSRCSAQQICSTHTPGGATWAGLVWVTRI